jgi:MFS family permease
VTQGLAGSILICQSHAGAARDEAKGENFLNPPQTVQDGSRGVRLIALSQFSLAFSFNVVMSFMPFYIVEISPYGVQETMLWIGMIMGLNSFIAAATAPLWGSLTTRFRPKRLFQAAFLSNGIVFLLMGFTHSLPALLALRLIQGVLGGASTIGFFMISRISSKERMAGNLSLYQNSMTAGQLLGPPVGAYLAAHLGYQSPFFISFMMISVGIVLCQIYIAEIGKKDERLDQPMHFNRGLLWGWVLSFIATIHLTFLPSILPHILEGFALTGKTALKSAGFIMMAYTASAIAGSHLISHKTPRTKLAVMISAICLAAAFFQVLLYFPSGMIGFTAIRMVQTALVAAVLPLVMANVASGMGGMGIGFINSARFAGNGVGPLLATFVLAGSNLLTLYLLIAVTTMGSVLAFLLTRKRQGK